jgi:zinc D-Ala-D-Ala carboxypeptidase
VKYFTIEEFACKHCGRVVMDGAFLEDVDQMRGLFGKPLVVTSGYRCPDHNAAVSSTGRTGPHTTGHAADFAVSAPAASSISTTCPMPPVNRGPRYGATEEDLDLRRH